MIRYRADDDARAHIAALDRRLARSHDVRLWETLVLVGFLLAAAVLAVRYGSAYLCRVGLLAAEAVLGASLVLSAATERDAARRRTARRDRRRPVPRSLAIPRSALPWALAAFVLAYLIVFTAWPEVASFSAIGESPDGGGRYYGAGNLVETVLLTVSLAAAALLGRRWILPMLVLALVTVGWSRAGADGGGIVVFLAAFAVLAARMYGVRWTWRRAGAAAVGIVLAVAALVGLDAASGGSSHVTHAFRRGPVSLAEDLWSRLHISVSSIGHSTTQSIVFAVSIAALVVFALLQPRFPAGDALLAGIAVSLLVNDSPGPVASAGALSYAVLFAYERVGRPARGRYRADNVGVDVPRFAART